MSMKLLELQQQIGKQQSLNQTITSQLQEKSLEKQLLAQKVRESVFMIAIRRRSRDFLSMGLGKRGVGKAVGSPCSLPLGGQ